MEKLKSDILRVTGKYLDARLYQVFFFGSRASGASHAGSDIDVGIRGPRPIAAAVMAKIRAEIEDLPVLYKIDVVDFQKAAPDFKVVASRHIEPIKKYD